MKLPFSKAYREEKAQAFKEKFLTLYQEAQEKDQPWLEDYKNENLAPYLAQFEQISDMNTPEKRFAALAKLAEEVDKAGKKFINIDARNLPSQEFLKDYYPSEAVLRGVLIGGFPTAMVSTFALILTGNPLFIVTAGAAWALMEIAGKTAKRDQKKVKNVSAECGIHETTDINPYNELSEKIKTAMDHIITNHLPNLLEVGFDEEYPEVKKAFLAEAKKQILQAPQRQPQPLPEGVLKHQKR